MIKTKNADFKNIDEIEDIVDLIYNTFCSCNKVDSSKLLIEKYEILYGKKKNLQNTIDYLKEKTDIFIIAKDGKKIAGIIRGSKDKIINLYTDPLYQGKGIGKLLLNKFEIKAKKLGSNTIQLKPSKFAYNFYIKNGFKQKDEKYLEKILD